MSARAVVSGLAWMQAVRDSSDLVDYAESMKYRRDVLGGGEVPRYVLPQTVKFVALAIGSFMNAQGVAEVGKETIRERFGIARNTVSNASVLLVRAGWLKVEPGGRGAKDVNRYLARVPSHATFFKSRAPVAHKEPGSSSDALRSKAVVLLEPTLSAPGEHFSSSGEHLSGDKGSPGEHLDHRMLRPLALEATARKTADPSPLVSRRAR